MAFVVLDGRMGDGYAFGMNYFAENIDADLIFPMHLWQEYELIGKCKHQPCLARLADRIVDIDRENIVYEVK